ncbi:hypothetical protein P175DRAFT_0559396 [Aspergillus ochraceoroseus IBT 24754]|uniref:Uncharacterized protein n=1 Tax=Aspergillus ochraceoroseus IBT 24754 TaxID=1392256 RepID=A0A2T5LQL5_9EURO|nr:uncharacterized protein P175DRAFT_0559396 [Aspergillus ochraceoroseus IBT 24754]PTU18575.1 hypothetical protein P175DRAFT_0559396 [Aspergillus ochraceoroseus IBT 24754]
MCLSNTPRCTLLQRTSAPSIPCSFHFVRENLALPRSLQGVIVGDLRDAFNHCRASAARAFRMMKSINRRRELRYKAMCPRDDAAVYLSHADSVHRLWDWYQDYNSDDPTLAPTPKIPSLLMKFRIDHRTYDQWAREYHRLLESFLEGPYRAWLDAKEEMEDLISKARLTTLNGANGELWQTFWGPRFLAEMEKWEEFLPELALPSYEDLVDEMYHAIRERVEDGERLSKEFYLYGTTTP